VTKALVFLCREECDLPDRGSVRPAAPTVRPIPPRSDRLDHRPV